jgi:hypothetical protein
MSTAASPLSILTLTLGLTLYAPVGQANQTKPLTMEPLFQVNPTDSADLSEQTRWYATADREAVLRAAATALQDMGYQVTGGQKEFGLLLGEKTADVPGAGAAHTIGEAALVTTTVILSLLTGQDMVTDLPEQVAQVVHVSLLVNALDRGAKVDTQVRISLDRDMIYDHGGIIPDHTELPLVYQEFFDRLSKSIYLEGEKL